MGALLDPYPLSTRLLLTTTATTTTTSKSVVMYIVIIASPLSALGSYMPPTLRTVDTVYLVWSSAIRITGHTPYIRRWA